MFNVAHAHQKFTGKKLEVTDPNLVYVNLNVQKPGGIQFQEKYTLKTPMLVIGNLVIGERYVEPSGAARIVNESTGDVADLEFKPRGIWSTKEADKFAVTGEVKDKEGQLKYTLSGKYTESIIATKVDTGETFTVFEAPVFPQGP